ncbi:S-adenosyl-L-methionine-dependent methyltransferase [Epithele typhae]|uniref:S-adenosyl-L-methionine-dependent methyltransferase n=1 Tax=Epithele typhae TaxID=378194 RepID=UPI002008CA36|nr:S-adenosyl-L-methionine-dependent methyltransferase [Epithele typhae]KAH9911687.1 S-adenosyl-L-methionine-dependent methyltransferase [Epithele typhae]
MHHLRMLPRCVWLRRAMLLWQAGTLPHDFTAANAAYFDEQADHVETEHPHWPAMAEKVVTKMRTDWPELFDPARTRALDFACGIGLISQNLHPHVQSVVGVDISQRSVERYNALARSLELAPEKMRAEHLELTGAPGELGGALFDLIVAAPDARRLFPDALAAVVPQAHGIAEDALRAAFVGAGLGAFELRDAVSERMPQYFGEDGPPIVWFVARGVKPLDG